MSDIIRVVDEKDAEVYGQKWAQVKKLITSKTAGSKNADLGILRLQPKKKTVPNIHPESEELFYILKGKGTLTVGQETKEIKAGQGVYIPSNVTHTFENTDEEIMEFLLIHSPPEPEEEIKGSPWAEEHA